MIDSDSVIKFAVVAADNNATEVRYALSAYIQNQTDSTRDGLRLALVAQASGFENGSHDGSTFEARKQAASDALKAWNGSEDTHTSIIVGSRQIRCERELAKKIGWTSSGWDCGSVGDSGLKCLAQALSNGLDGEMAVLRAIAIHTHQTEAHNKRREEKLIAEEESKAAGMNLAAQREIAKRM